MTPKLDNLFQSHYQDYLMKWISLIGLLVCGSVNAQSVICERYGALPVESQHTFNWRLGLKFYEVIFCEL